MGSEMMMSTCSGSDTSSTLPGITTIRSVRLLLFTSTWKRVKRGGSGSGMAPLDLWELFGSPCPAHLGVLGHGAGFHRVDFPRPGLRREEGEDPGAAADVQDDLGKGGREGDA